MCVCHFRWQHLAKVVAIADAVAMRQVQICRKAINWKLQNRGENMTRIWPAWPANSCHHPPPSPLTCLVVITLITATLASLALVLFAFCL